MPSTAGGAGSMAKFEKPAISSFVDSGGSSLGRSALGASADGFDSCVPVAFDGKEEGGKCLFLYF